MNQASVAPPELCERPASSDVPKSEPAVALHERRRLGERAPVQLDATVFRGAELRLTHTLDLSSTGCALRACADPLTGSVTLQLVSTGGELLRLQALFKRSFQGADAYEFVDLDDAERLTIAEIIDMFRSPEH